MKAALDTNVLISAFLSDGPPRKVLGMVLAGDIALIISAQLLSEFRGVVSRKKFGFSKDEIKRMTELIESAAYIVKPKDRIDVIKEDPDDNRVLECALAGGVEYIVTGDNHLLNLGEYKGIKTVTASRFLSSRK